MSSPDLSAIVPPHTRVRLTYGLAWEAISFGEPDYLVGLVNDAWQGYNLAVVYSPATAPTDAPDTILGAFHNAYTTLDVLTAANLPTITWDQWLASMRSISPALYDLLHVGDSASLNQVDLVTAGGSVSQAAANTQASQAAAQQAAQHPSNPVDAFVAGAHGLLTTLQNNLGLVAGAVIVAGVVALALIYGRKGS